MAKNSDNGYLYNDNFINSRNHNMKTVLTFGTFDLAHPGHIAYLTEAKSHGDYLVTVIARDSNVSKSVLHSEEQRKQQIEKLNIADKVILGSKNNKMEVIHEYAPDIICLGYDQQADEEQLAKLTNAKIIRCKSFKPHVFKSKILKKNL